MAYVAKGRLVHGTPKTKTSDAQRFVFEDGEELDESLFTKQQLKALVDSGAVESTGSKQASASEGSSDDGSSTQGQGSSQTPPAS
jgi:hypothetical protein